MLKLLNNLKEIYYHKNVIQNIKNLLMIELYMVKMFCDNPNCSHKTFAETHDFIERSKKNKKTNSTYY